MNLINHHRIFFVAVIVFIIGIIAFFFLTRYNHVPVALTLGKCTMDYTSPASYSDRVSPLESEEFSIRGWDMVVCYGSPSLRGRAMIGDRIPLDQPWRLGANEPTRFYTTADVELGGLYLPKGRYSLYAVPGRFDWEIFVNKSVSHWGNDLSPKVTSKNVGSFKIEPEYILRPVETMTFRIGEIELSSPNAELIFEWENTQLIIPIVNREEEDKTDYSLRQSS